MVIKILCPGVEIKNMIDHQKIEGLSSGACYREAVSFNELEITVVIVRDLLNQQCPQWSDLNLVRMQSKNWRIIIVA